MTVKLPGIPGEMQDEFAFYDLQHFSDGALGFYEEWVESDIHFNGAFIHNTTIQAQIAEAERSASTYELYLPKGVVTRFPQVIKRLRDGQLFRITSDSADQETPPSAGLQMARVNAEKWRVADD